MTLSEGRTGPQEHQPGVIRRRKGMTHKLGVERGHKDVSRVTFRTREEDDIHAGGRARPQEHQQSRMSFSDEKRQHTNWGGKGLQESQQVIIQQKEEMTHVLAMEQDRESISKVLFSNEKRRRMVWGCKGGH